MPVSGSMFLTLLQVIAKGAAKQNRAYLSGPVAESESVNQT